MCIRTSVRACVRVCVRVRVSACVCTWPVAGGGGRGRPREIITVIIIIVILVQGVPQIFGHPKSSRLLQREYYLFVVFFPFLFFRKFGRSREETGRDAVNRHRGDISTLMSGNSADGVEVEYIYSPENRQRENIENQSRPHVK